MIFDLNPLDLEFVTIEIKVTEISLCKASLSFQKKIRKKIKNLPISIAPLGQDQYCPGFTGILSSKGKSNKENQFKVGLVGLNFTSLEHLRSYQDVYRLMTMRTHGDFIVLPH